MAVNVDVQRIDSAYYHHFDGFSVVYVISSCGGAARLYFECDYHEEKAKAVADAINSK